MKTLALTAALGAACLTLAGCGGSENADANNTAAVGDADGAATAGDNTAATAGTDSGATASSASTYPKGARIVEENGVTYRIDADGTRVRLGENDSRIVVEKGVRYRVDPSGTRVKINDQGLDIDLPDLTPDVDVGINNKGNLDVDVSSKPDGDKGPN